MKEKFISLSSCFSSPAVWDLICAVLFISTFTRKHKLPSHDVVVISNTYYSDGKSGYPANTMAMLFNAPRHMWPRGTFLCVSKNSTEMQSSFARVRYAFDPIGICKWTTFLLTCPTVENPQSFVLADTQVGSSDINIPYREAVKKQMGVVACFSPLFYNERWQLLIPTLEIYRQMGVDLQNFYVQSMIGEVFDFLQVYENQGIAKIATWNSLVLDQQRLKFLGYDPNSEMEWRNQPTAHIDCFLRYKQAAEFIIISDIDDILFPRLGNTYLEEFRRLSSSFPLVASFAYNRYNTEVVSSNSEFKIISYSTFFGLTNEDFSLSSLVKSARISSQWEDGKYVVVSKHVETTWLHWPGIKNESYNVYRVDNNLNIMIHFRNWSLIDYSQTNATTNIKQFHLFNNQINDYFNATDKLEENFHEFLNQHARREFEQLPKNVHYYPLVEQCYDRIFYGRAKKPESCPGPVRCVLPPIKGLRCVVAQKQYRHEQLGNVKVHFPINEGTFVINENGCTL